tara:strand:+ start:5493 stop:5936 length:444 start_codon:yes stop_codon:yes gene_type:complete
MNANITKTVLGGLLPFITNPATLAIIGIGAVGLTIYDILTDKKDGQGNGSEPQINGSEPLIVPFLDGSTTVDEAALEPLETASPTAFATAHSTDREPFPAGGIDSQKEEEVETCNPEDEKKELIRQAMSELGKRSGAARRHKAQSKS